MNLAAYILIVHRPTAVDQLKNVKYQRISMKMINRSPVLQFQAPDLRGLLLLLVAAILMAFKMMPQCTVDIDFNDWSEVGPADNGNWSAPPNGQSVLQSSNGDPTFFVGPNNFMNVRISGSIQVDESTVDDDYVGFVFSVVSPESLSQTSETTFDMWLLDWKSGVQSSADEGFSLVKIDQTFDFDDASSFMPYFWTHNSNSGFDIKEQVFGEGLGWVPGQQHMFELILRSDRVTISIDGNEIIDREDCFDIGKFGFYNFSQENVNYSNFSYEIFSEFSVPESLCVGIPFTPGILNSNCPSNINDLNSIIDNWFWEFGNDEYSFQMLPVHSYENAGTYEVTLTITDHLGCSAEISQEITVEDKATVSIQSESGCVGEELFFSAIDESIDAEVIGFAWDFDSNGSTDASGEIVSQVFDSEGEYPISVIAMANGCNDTATANIIISPLPNADFDFTILSGRNLQLENLSENAEEYYWNFSDGQESSEAQPTHMFLEDGEYEITLEAENNGCVDEVTKTVVIYYQDLTFIPTAFSPNGDGNNDNFRVLGSDLLSMEMCVFNHWGELIFQGTDINQGWDGTANGNRSQTGNYTYLITGTKSTGEKVSYQGLVALVR